jgi:hypothetical protein
MRFLRASARPCSKRRRRRRSPRGGGGLSQSGANVIQIINMRAYRRCGLYQPTWCRICRRGGLPQIKFSVLLDTRLIRCYLLLKSLHLRLGKKFWEKKWEMLTAPSCCIMTTQDKFTTQRTLCVCVYDVLTTCTTDTRFLLLHSRLHTLLHTVLLLA